MHAVRHQYSIEQVDSDRRGRWTAPGSTPIEVAHGDGLAGSTCNYGFGAHTDLEWIDAVAGDGRRARRWQRCCCRESARSAISRRPTGPARPSVRVATHCTEADIAAEHIAAARELGMDTVGFLMMSHMSTPTRWPSRPR